MNAYWLDDPRSVSENNICQMAGVSKPSLYRSFGSEDGLMSAALERYATQVLTEILELLDSDRGFDETLDDLVSFVSDDPRMQTGCLLQKMSQCEQKLGPSTRVVIRELLTTAYEAYKVFLTPYQETELRSGVGLELGARYLGEQLSFAAYLRGAGMESAQVRSLFSLSLSALKRRIT